ncbi:hypothetical protein GCM10009127_24260 [Alteraurantiacibacter aestuarii]|uniref:NAD(P)H-binding protein n=1 Tax=Alteraurantiacibacter aestuarii TaxID=650004 RepID=UPI0031D3B244
MSDLPRILLVGATGLVAGHVLDHAVGRADMHMLALARGEVPLPHGARMEVLVAPVEGWEDAIAAIAPDRVICALGTTIARTGGDKDAFAAVDRDLVLQLARYSKAAGASSFAVISSVGAAKEARNFYLRTKGEMEAGLAKIGFARLDILQPGLLRGARTGAIRPMERIAMVLAPLMDIFLQGERRKYRSIKAETVAAAALQCAHEKARGTFVHQHDGILRLASRFSRS